nr:CoA transferase [Pantoea bituminis]
MYDAADIANDPHYQARDMLLKEQLPDGTSILLPGIVPKLLASPGTLRSRAPELGEHTEEVLMELGMSEEDLERLKQKGTV